MEKYPMITLNQIQDIAKTISPETTCGEFFDNLYKQDPGAIYYKLLFNIVKHTQPTATAELGICTGRGTAHLAGGHLPGRVFGIDPAPYEIGYIIEKCPNIRIIKGRSDEPRVLSMIENGSLDICFIDSIHAGDYAAKEVSLWRPKMKPGGLLLFDDVWLNPSMRRFWDNLQLPKIAIPRMHLTGGGEDVGFGCATL